MVRYDLAWESVPMLTYDLPLDNFNVVTKYKQRKSRWGLLPPALLFTCLITDI